MCRAAILEHGVGQRMTRRGPAQRAEAEAGTAVWGPRYKGPLESLFWEFASDPERRMGTRSGIR